MPPTSSSPILPSTAQRAVVHAPCSLVGTTTEATVISVFGGNVTAYCLPGSLSTTGNLGGASPDLAACPLPGLLAFTIESFQSGGTEIGRMDRWIVCSRSWGFPTA